MKGSTFSIAAIAVVMSAALITTAGAQQPSAPLVLTLGDAARLAARQSAQSVIAHLRTREAEARVTQSRADLFPTLHTSALESGHTLNSATFGFDFPTAEGEAPLLDPNGQIIGPVNTLDLRAHVTVPAIDFAARERVSSARASLRASEAAAQNAADQAAAVAAQAYLRAARAEALVRARAADSTLADSLLVIANAQLTAGVGVGLDVTRARSQLAAAHSQLIAARGERSRTMLELVRAIGAPMDATVTLSHGLEADAGEPIPTESEAIAIALKQRSDIAAAERSLEAARQGSKAIRAERLPVLAAFADDGAIGTSTQHLLNTYTWGVQVSLPLFDGFKRSGRLNEQQAVEAQLDVQLRELGRDITVQVRSALLDLSVSREQLGAANGRLSLARQEYAEAQDRFRAGVAGNADVVAAAIALNGARNAVIEAETAYQSARVSLARAEGIATQLE
jgi:outer membrane protein TolC